LKEPVHDDRVIIGYNGKDDAAVVRLSGDKYLVQTVDFFTPVVDDPYQFGQIAATNSLSDIYAMGAEPVFALNIVGFPIQQLPREMLTQILQGGADKAAEAGITIVGGHSVDDNEPKYGLVVTGEVHKDDLITNDKAQPGDVLVLTKPIGTGMISTAIKKGIADPIAIQTAVKSMSYLNKYAAECMDSKMVNAATDITGFGLLGHLLEMCQASGVSANIEYGNIPLLPSAMDLAKKGIIPGGTKRNLAFVSQHVKFSSSITPIQKLMCADAQTSGGLLISMPKSVAIDYIEQLNKKSPFTAVIIGEIITKEDELKINVV